MFVDSGTNTTNTTKWHQYYQIQKDIEQHFFVSFFYASTVTCHLTTTLRSCSCYESPRKFGDADTEALVINKVKPQPPQIFFLLLFFSNLRNTLFDQK